MLIIVFILLFGNPAVSIREATALQQGEIEIVQELFRLRNEHKADSAELFFADTVKVYMKYLRYVPKQLITRSDKTFWKAHPNNKFEMTAPIEIITTESGTTAIVKGKEYLDGTSYTYERIEIRFDRNKKIYWYRGFSSKDGRYK